MAQDASIAFARTLRRSSRLLRLVDDERLVALASAGDETAFEAIYDRHYRKILAFSRHMLGSREEAEDAVQHTFIAAHRALTTAEQPNALRPWLFAIARNRCLSMLRARRHQVPLDDVEPATEGLSATVERREDLRQLLGDLGRLPEEQRTALLLAELAALDHEGIAEVLGCRREKVKALVYQARSSLTAARDARATSCDDIREQLATATGAALRRGPLRRHLSDCPGCRAFQHEVKLQHKLFAMALPVIPTATLKASVLGAITANGTGGSAGGCAAAAHVACASSTGAGGATSGGIGALMATGTAKVAATVALGGAVAGGGAAVTLERPSNDRPVAAAQSGTTSARATGALTTQLARSTGGQVRALTPTLRRPAQSAPPAERAAPSTGTHVQAVDSPPAHVGQSGGDQAHELSDAPTDVNAYAAPDRAHDREDRQGHGDGAPPPGFARRGADASPGRSNGTSPGRRAERPPDSAGNVPRPRAPRAAPQPPRAPKRARRPDVAPAPAVPRAMPAPGNAAPGNAAPGNAAPGNAAPGNAAPGHAAPRPNAAPRAPPPPSEGAAAGPRGGSGNDDGGSGDGDRGADGGPTPTAPAVSGRAAPESSGR